MSAAPAVLAGPVGWAHQAAGFQSDGAITVKSLAVGSYAGTHNPSGAVVKANQSASTQAPTVIIQATSSSTFNYRDDCFLFQVSAVPGGNVFIGAGKLDSSSKFTGILGVATGTISSSSGPYTSGAVVLAMLTGPSTASNNNPHFCGSDPSCLNNTAATPSGGLQVIYKAVPIIVTSLPVSGASKCFP